LLIQRYATVLPPGQVVIEILEDVFPDEEVIEACKSLKALGYTLALDDFVDTPDYLPLAELADIIKVDFLKTSPEHRRQIVKTYGPRGVKLLAEKIETQEAYEEAVSLGYSYFQGYFFSRPVVFSSGEMSASKMGLMEIIREVNQPEFDFDRIADLVQHEVAITYKLLRYVNSAAMARRAPITSVRAALSRLGSRELKKWISVLALAVMAEDKPSELIVLSLVRARFCELSAIASGRESKQSEFFLLGLFSLLDAIVDQPMDILLEELPLSDEIQQALLGTGGQPLMFLQLSKAVENGEWHKVVILADKLGLSEEELGGFYRDAMAFANAINQ
jgi:EAL and modified HD-GYP domain-containing signal transduction protein